VCGLRTFTRSRSTTCLNLGLTRLGLVWRMVLDFPAIRVRLTLSMELKHE
jgi:hypothetical protein